jgi:hypothetical protein
MEGALRSLRILELAPQYADVTHAWPGKGLDVCGSLHRL